MQYISTRNSALRKSFSEVLLGGLASDGGLYMPRKTQFFSMGQINDFKNLSYGGLTAQILQAAMLSSLPGQQVQQPGT